MSEVKKNDLEGKYLIAFDTIFEGHQTSKDEDGNPAPQLFDSYDEAFKELFSDAIAGMEGNEDALDGYDLDYDEALEKMEQIWKSGDVEAMKNWMDEWPETNYYDDFIEKADEFILGRKAIFTGTGVTIKGEKL